MDRGAIRGQRTPYGPTSYPKCNARRAYQQRQAGGVLTSTPFHTVASWRSTSECNELVRRPRKDDSGIDGQVDRHTPAIGQLKKNEVNGRFWRHRAYIGARRNQGHRRPFCATDGRSAPQTAVLRHRQRSTRRREDTDLCGSQRASRRVTKRPESTDALTRRRGHLEPRTADACRAPFRPRQKGYRSVDHSLGRPVVPTPLSQNTQPTNTLNDNPALTHAICL